MISSKKQLEVSLSKLNQVNYPKVGLEQYPTPSNIAAEVLWSAYMNNDIKNKIIADFGCGTGVLGIGALLLGAKKVYFVDVDKKILEICKSNSKDLGKKAVFFNKDVKDFDKKVDVVIQNPPFGVKKEHADKLFLEKSMDISNKIYSFHKIESKNFISKLAADKNFKVENILEFEFKLKKSMKFHKRKFYKVKVGFWVLERLL